MGWISKDVYDDWAKRSGVFKSRLEWYVYMEQLRGIPITRIPYPHVLNWYEIVWEQRRGEQQGYIVWIYTGG